MAWNKIYQIPFQSRTGTQYMVFIYENTSTTPTVVTLTGAAEPFVTQEDSDDNIFMPIRKQTGYIRVIDETNDGSLLETLIPTNNTQKLVRLYTGSWNSDYTTFTPAYMKWQGFMCAEAFTQSWDRQKKVIELPVKSLLACMDDVMLPMEYYGTEITGAQLLKDAYDAVLGGYESYAFNGVYVFDSNIGTVNPSSGRSNIVHLLVQMTQFYHSETILSDNTETTVIKRDSYGTALSALFAAFGYSAREFGNELYLSRYEGFGATLSVVNYWSRFSLGIIEGGSTQDPTVTDLTTENILTAVTFRGSDNIAGFIQGRKAVEVRLNLSEDGRNITDIPVISPDGSLATDPTGQTTPTEVDGDNGSGDNLYIIQYVQRTESNETYTNYRCKSVMTTLNPPSYHYSSFTSLNYSALMTALNAVASGNPQCPYKPLTYPSYKNNDDYEYAAALPVRFFVQSGGSQVDLRSGLLLITPFINNQWEVEYDGVNHPTDAVFNSQFNNIYTLASESVTLNNGYIRVLIDQVASLIYQATDTLTKKSADTLFIRVRMGNQYWDEANHTWTTNANIRYAYTNNKADSDNVADPSGFYVPIGDSMTGIVRLTILGMVKSSEPDQNVAHYFNLIQNINISFVRSKDTSASGRDQNVYRTELASTGFGSTESIDLAIGTFNNNKPSYSFLMFDSSTYVNILNGARPEKKLLDRMGFQYNGVKRTYKAVAATGLDLLTVIYTLPNGVLSPSRFFGIDAQHNWRDETQEVKFIEVT